VLEACHENGLTPMVTLHHFTSPRWFVARGGWEDETNVPYFRRYAERMMAALGELIPFVCTINEPNIVASMGWRAGVFPPGKRDRELRARVDANFVRAHAAAVDVVRAARGGAQVGLTLAMTDYQSLPGGEEHAAHIRGQMHDVYLDAVA